MRVALFSTKPYDRQFFEAADASARHELTFLTPRLTPETSPLAAGFPGVCAFVSDVIDRTVVDRIVDGGTRLLAMRCAGFNNVDLAAASERGLTVVRVPAYSPYAVAEHAVAMMLALNRQIHRAYARVREGNFALEGLLGFDMHGRTVGIIGTGQIGAVVARILNGFGCRLLAYDVRENDTCRQLGVEYCGLDDIYRQADIMTLHSPLTRDTFHMIDERALGLMKPGVMLINTSRGAVVDTPAVLRALKSGRVGYLGLDVYEEEADLFFEDRSNLLLADDILARLLTFPNVIITGHQAFFTREALARIAETTLANISDFEQGRSCANVVRAT